ncbi:hypothetical protein FACS1894109_19200 [Spirochaetia bacterium]|nr:hypothetical protein FACS1894109_19200 [Spirochaetia bacterium]
MDTLAITFKMDRRVDRVVTPLSVQQAEDYCRTQNFEYIKFDVRAMWDTGSTGCCISQNLADSLGLTSIASLDLVSAHGSKPSDVYILDILMPDGVLVKNVLAAEIVPSGEFDMIIGMNIISLGDFAISNDNGKTVMSFRLPTSDIPIDFSKLDILL